MLNDILILGQQWLPNQSNFPPISWPWYRAWPSPIMSGFHGAFATGVACQQGTLTLPNNWFRPPLWDLFVLQLLRRDSSNLPCLYSTFHLDYPLVLSWFCFTIYRANFLRKVVMFKTKMKYRLFRYIFEFQVINIPVIIMTLSFKSAMVCKERVITYQMRDTLKICVC